MAKTRDYMDYLDSKIEIAPANSQEEYQAAETIAEILRDHELETTIEEFDSHPFGQLVGPILTIILFACLVVAGLTEGTVHIVLMVVAAICVGLPLYLHFSGTRLFEDLGPGSTSQNVVAVHRATGDKVIKGARPIVIVAHYDTPRQSLLRRMPFAQYQAAIRTATIPCAIAVAVTLVFQFLMFLPGIILTFMWVVGLIAALPLLLLAIIDIIDRFGSCTTGANDNKSSVAALLSIANKVRPTKDRVDDDSEGREGKPLRRRIHDAPEKPAEPRRIEVLEEVKGVRHGANVLSSLGILPETCEIVYQEPRLQVIEEESVTSEDASTDNDYTVPEIDADGVELESSYDDDEYEEYDGYGDTNEDLAGEDDTEEEYSNEEFEEDSYDDDEWLDDYDDEDDSSEEEYEEEYEEEDESTDEDLEEEPSLDEEEEEYEVDELDDLEEDDEEFEDEEDEPEEDFEDEYSDEDEGEYADDDEYEEIDFEDEEEYDDEESESFGSRFMAIWEAIKTWFLERIAAIREFFSKDRGTDINIERGKDRRSKSGDSSEYDEWVDEYDDNEDEDEEYEEEADEEEGTDELEEQEEADLPEGDEDERGEEIEEYQDNDSQNPYEYADDEVLAEDENDFDDDLDDDVPFFEEYEQLDDEYVDEGEIEDSLDENLPNEYETDEYEEQYEENYEEELDDDYEFDDNEPYEEYEPEETEYIEDEYVEDEYVEDEYAEEVEEEEDTYAKEENEYEQTYDEYEEETNEDEFEEDVYEDEETTRSPNQENSMTVGERLTRFFSMIRSTPAPEGEEEYDEDNEPYDDRELREQFRKSNDSYHYSATENADEYEAYAGAYEDGEKNEVREIAVPERRNAYAVGYTDDLDEDAYGYEDVPYQPSDYVEDAYYEEEYAEPELNFEDKGNVQAPHILPDPNKLHFDREEDADILPRDTTGLDTLSDSYDLYTGEVDRVSKRQKPEPLADPNWGVSSYQPARPVMNIARRAALFDLPDPSAEAVDPLYNERDEYEEETYDEYASYETYEVDEPYDELTEMEEIVRAEAGEAAESFDGSTSDLNVAHEEKTVSKADDDRSKGGNSRNAAGFWSDNRSSDWKGGATVRSDLRDDMDNVPLILDADDLQDAILELGDDFLVAHDIWFVATGASEVGHAGIRAFIEEHRRDIRGSFLVNLDSIGAGTLSLLVREGMSAPRRADRRLVRMIGDIANDLHVKLDTAMYTFDERESATTMRSRIRSVTIAGLDENDLPAYSHTANDVPENVDPKQVSNVVRLITELIRRS